LRVSITESMSERLSVRFRPSKAFCQAEGLPAP
jgi:hypothetical protein